jgi:hypothetical protein
MNRLMDDWRRVMSEKTKKGSREAFSGGEGDTRGRRPEVVGDISKLLHRVAPGTRWRQLLSEPNPRDRTNLTLEQGGQTAAPILHVDQHDQGRPDQPLLG